MAENQVVAANTSIKGCNVQVAVRCRPLNSEEKKSNQPTVITCDAENKSIKVAYGPVGKKTMKNFTFDKVFGMYSRQEEVFEHIVRPIVDETLAGFNCTIFAYGQTGTGKTHTMEGDINSPEDAGIVPRAVNAILEQLEGSGTEFTIRVSFLELYNEELQDLLNTSGEKKLKLCEDVKKGVVCQNLEEIAVLNASDILEILQRGIQQRQTAATLCNKNSSRSHSIFTMKIMIKEYNVEGEEVVRHGQLNLVDLAGSECIGRSGAKNDRAREAGSINQSLLTLGRVITALVDHHPHVPYRDSKLTRLLQESLGGKAKTCIIATLSPSHSAVEETMSTLDYAYRAKNIKNQPTVNQKLTKKVIMKEYFAEIETLRTQLLMTREKNGVYVDPQAFYAMESKISSQEALLLECEAALKQRNEDFKSVKVENEELTTRLEDAIDELTEKHEELMQVRDELEVVKDDLSSTFVELKATEAVVGEQTKTEKDLSSLGHSLERNIGEKTREIEALLHKIVAFQNSDNKRISCSKAFTTELKQSSTQLIASLQTLIQQNTNSSTILHTGIATMLTKGKDTCDSLQQALDAAIQVLLQDTKKTKDEMIASCSDLTKHVQENQHHVCAQLTEVQKGLSVWLQSTCSTISDMHTQLTQQQTSLVSMQTTVQEHQIKAQRESEQFLAQQEALASKFQKELLVFKDQLITSQATYFSDLDSEFVIQQKTLQSKAKTIESTISSLLKDLVQVNTDMTSMNQQKASQYQVNQINLIQSVAGSLQQSSVQSFKQEEDYQKQLLQSLAMHTRSEISSIQSLQAGVQAPMTNMHDILLPSIGLKRKSYDDEMTEINSNVVNMTHHTTDRICVTANMAETVLTKVHQTSTTMTAAIGQDVTRLKDHLSHEGAQVYEVLKDHFVGLESTTKEHQQQVGGMQSNTTTFAQEYPTYLVQSSGHTPKKCKVLVPVVYASTRDHQLIKQEIRSQPLKDITHVEIQQAIQQMNVEPIVESVVANPISSPIVSMEDVAEEVVEAVTPPPVIAAIVVDSENIAPMTNIIPPPTSSSASTTPTNLKLTKSIKSSRIAGATSSSSKSVATRSTRSASVTTTFDV